MRSWASVASYLERARGQALDEFAGVGEDTQVWHRLCFIAGVIQANCRAQFTADDFSFVVRVLAQSQRDAVSLVSLLSNETERDAVLDHDLIYHSLVDQTGCLRVSSAFYFYILTRRVLRRVAIEERALTDYVAAVLLAFLHTQQLGGSSVKQGSAPGFTYISDLLIQLEKCPPEQAHHLRAHVADYSLFLSGMFAERVQARAERRGAPDLSFYEAVGRSSYLSSARDPRVRRTDLAVIFEALGSEFRGVRLALNDLADTLLHFHGAPSIIRAS